MDSLLKEYSIPRERVVVMGDSSGDVPMMNRAGFSIAIHGNSAKLLKIANVSVTQDNLMIVSSLIEDYLTDLEIRRPRHRR